MTDNEAAVSLPEAVGVLMVAYRQLNFHQCWTLLYLQAELLHVAVEDVAAFVQLRGQFPS